MNRAVERIAPTPVERPWGGDGVPPLGLKAPAGQTVGEWWIPTRRFPVLVKIIDARENLSVQLHPDDEIARELNYPSGKTEAWHVLAAEPGASILIGLVPGTDPVAFFDAAERGEDVSSSLRRIPAVAGQTVFVPPGTIHAIGAGVTLLEAQQDADVTLRVFDWNRKPPRPLHIDQARRAYRDDPRAGVVEPQNGELPEERLLIDCDHFRMSEFRVRGSLRTGPRPGPQLWFCREGDARLRAQGSVEDLAPGAFALVDPEVPVEVEAAGEEARLLRVEP